MRLPGNLVILGPRPGGRHRGLIAAERRRAIVKAPRNPNEPVENPALSRALERLATDTSSEAKEEVLTEIQRATYLVAILTDGADMEPTEVPGEVIFKKGTQIQVLEAESDGLSFLALFTDRGEIAEYTDVKVTAMILPAAEAWAFALQDGASYDGAVINPAGHPLPLGRPLLEFLHAQDSEQAN